MSLDGRLNSVTSARWLTRPDPGATLGPADLHALDDALLEHVATRRPDAPGVVLLVEDSAGHVVSRAAEMRFESQFLAHHAADIVAQRIKPVPKTPRRLKLYPERIIGSELLKLDDKVKDDPIAGWEPFFQQTLGALA